MEKTRASAWKDVAGLLILATAYRLAFLWATPRVIDSADAIHYLQVARTFPPDWAYAVGERLPLLYSALGAFARLAVSDAERACMLVSFVSAALLPVPVYLLGRILHGRAPALLAGVLVCLSPWLADYGCRVAPDALAATLWFTALYTLVRAMRSGGVWPIFAALAFFALHLARPEGTFLLFAAPFGGLLLGVGAPGCRLRRLAPFVLIAATLLGMQALFLRGATGQAALNARVEDMGGLLDFLWVRGIDILRAAMQTWSHVLPVMIGPFFLLFAGLGLMGPSQRARDGRAEVLVGFYMLLQCTLAILSAYAEPRYVMAPVAAAYFWSARGIVLATDTARAFPGRVRLMRFAPAACLAAVLLVSTAGAVLPEYLGRTPGLPREYQLAGEWMREHLEPGLILTRKPQVGYYAGMPTTGPVAADAVADAIVRARNAGARYMVIDERYTAKLIPGLAPLLEPSNAPPGLRLLRADLSPYPDARIVIYEVLP